MNYFVGRKITPTLGNILFLRNSSIKKPFEQGKCIFHKVTIEFYRYKAGFRLAHTNSNPLSTWGSTYMELLRLLIEIQCGNVGAGKIIVRKFIPLVKKYSAKLKSEDAYDELLLVLWSTVLKIDPLQLMIISDGVIVSYIEKSIFRAYVRMAKTEQRRQIEMSIEELSEIQKFNYLCSSDCEWGCLSELYFSDLTKRESLVLKMYYELGYNTSEIASCLHSSRQIVLEHT